MMMTKEQLVAKRGLYEAKKVEIATMSYDEAIEAEIAEYRKSLIQKYEAMRSADMMKVNHYLTLLDELITEIDVEEVTTEPTSV